MLSERSHRLFPGEDGTVYVPWDFSMYNNDVDEESRQSGYQIM